MLFVLFRYKEMPETKRKLMAIGLYNIFPFPISHSSKKEVVLLNPRFRTSVNAHNV